MIEYIITNGWSILAAVVILGFITVTATFFIAFSLSMVISFVRGALIVKDKRHD